jgi:hypothetical protein
MADWSPMIQKMLLVLGGCCYFVAGFVGFFAVFSGIELLRLLQP